MLCLTLSLETVDQVKPTGLNAGQLMTSLKRVNNLFTLDDIKQNFVPLRTSLLIFPKSSQG